MKSFKEYFEESSDIINSPEFKRWFGNSKVTTEKEKERERDYKQKEGWWNIPVEYIKVPLRVYHGTIRSFDKFNTDLIWFTDNPQYASHYSGTSDRFKVPNDGKSYSPRTIPAYLSIQKPLYTGNVQGTGWLSEYFREWGIKLPDSLKHLDKIDKEAFRFLYDPEVLDYIKSLGYDGIAASENNTKTWAVFSNDQIKSALSL